MSTTDGFIGMFRVPEPGVTVPKITDISAATIVVTEIVELIGSRAFPRAKIDIGNVDIVEGAITGVCIEYQLSTGTWQPDEVTIVSTFPVSWSGADQGGTFKIGGIQYVEEGLNSDFRVYFINTDGEKAVDLATGKVIGVAPTAGAGWLEIDDVTFDGHPDLAEFPMVLDLRAVNASNTEGILSFTTPANIPNSGIMKLAWKDMKREIAKTAHPMANGTTANVPIEAWRKFDKYIVFMFIAATGIPSTTYPWSSETTGTWYAVAETANNFIDIDCPKNKKICFCVACKLWLSGDTTVIGGTSTTAALPNIAYVTY